MNEKKINKKIFMDVLHKLQQNHDVKVINIVLYHDNSDVESSIYLLLSYGEELGEFIDIPDYIKEKFNISDYLTDLLEENLNNVKELRKKQTYWKRKINTWVKGSFWEDIYINIEEVNI